MLGTKETETQVHHLKTGGKQNSERRSKIKLSHVNFAVYGANLKQNLGWLLKPN